MTHRPTPALLAAGLLLAACTSAGPTVEPGPTLPAATPGVVLDQAEDVATRLESREAELEALVP
ncbi:MAG: hypothetical protein JW785_01345 [Acidimicrobiia bacterium]|nr:hypothetical protein [Acidimicrobiia bacterium]